MPDGEMRTLQSQGYATSMDYEQPLKSVPKEIAQQEFENIRPRFINEKDLLSRYPCALCSKVLIKPHQTPCGNRVCKKCIDDEFKDRSVIVPCPLSHDDLDDDEILECVQNGLSRSDVHTDFAATTALTREKCFCKNQPYGCCDKIQWRKLKDHEASCQFQPVACPNKGCSELMAQAALSTHIDSCGYNMVECSYCKASIPKRLHEQHLSEECDYAETQCSGCGRQFPKRKQLVVHQKIAIPCLTRLGRCHYYDYCGFESQSVEEFRDHLERAKDLHLESLTLQVDDLKQLSFKSQDTQEQMVKKTVNHKVKPLERITASLSMQVSKLEFQLESSETSGEHLVNAMKLVNQSSQQVDSVQSRVAQIERQIKDAGLDRVTVIESHSQTIKRHNDALNDMEKRMRNQEVGSFNGTLIWKIKDYKRRKGEAIRGRQMSIYSHPFYTSKNGYKMCLRAYLNGDGLGRGKCLSLFFVLMRGEYDELLEFPFKQRVTFTMICPKTASLSKHESFLPDPDSSSFRKPQTEMNIASGCPQFAPHSEVESSNFLVNDCLYIRAKVEPGGDVIP